MNEPNYLTVSDLNQYLHKKFLHDDNLKNVYVKGEISNFRYRPNTHQYFRLKDAHSVISVVMFKNFANRLDYQPKEGMNVLISGWVSTYTRDGEYELYAKDMSPTGVGKLYEQYTQLRNKLYNEGLFNTAHKKPIPQFPKRIGVITSRNGAVIKDIIKTTRARWPSTQLVLYPANVQGEKATGTLVNQIKRADATASFSTLIVGRGGGSIEDLQCFNSESLAREIYQCRTPIISSVGHGINHTIADMVADLSVVTPTAAAEEATPDIKNFIKELASQLQLINSITDKRLTDASNELQQFQQSYALQHPERLLNADYQDVKSLDNRMDSIVLGHMRNYSSSVRLLKSRLDASSPKNTIDNQAQRLKLMHNQLMSTTYNYLADLDQQLDDTGRNLNNYAQEALVNKIDKVKEASISLNALDPYKILKQGYSLITVKGRPITNINSLSANQKVTLNLSNGHALATVNRKYHNRKEPDHD